MNNIYEQCCVLLRYSDYEAFGAFVLLAASAVIAFPAAFAALVMFYLARDKKKDEFEQAQYTGEEPEENGLEGPHVLSAREDVGPLHSGVYLHDRPRDEFLFVDLKIGQHRFERIDEVSPDYRLAGDLGDLARGNDLALYYLKSLFQQRLAAFSRVAAVEKEVKGIEVPVFGVDPVARESASQTVGPVVHRQHRAGYEISRDPLSLLRDHRRYCASRRYPDASFDFHVNSSFPPEVFPDEDHLRLFPIL